MKKKTSVLKNLWWIIKNIYQYDKGYIWVITFSVIILGIIPSIFTLISQTIINSIQIGREIKFIFFGVILYIALDIVNNILISAFSYYKTRFNKGFMLEIQEQILEKASRLSLQNYEDSETYDVIHRAQYEGSGSLSTYFDTFAGVISSFITMFSYLLILVMFNPIIAAGVLYFLDEPNAALDAIAEYDLSGLYEKMLKNKIGIIVAHKFNNFIKKIEQIVVLDGGKVVAIGKHEELLTNNNIYKELFEIQMGNSTVK